MNDEFTIALAGNPNSGKTTVFNRITGTHQHVGNYPGVTVEIKEGTRRIDSAKLKIIDLPGTYSLTALSEEELVARDYIVENKPDVVVDVIDASTLERQLYLAIQLLELGVPLVLAFNMSDMAERAGIKFDIPLLSELLGAPIVHTTGTSGGGIDELLDISVKVARKEIRHTPKPLSYGRDLDNEIENIVTEIEKAENLPFKEVPAKWIAIKLLENDSQVLEKFKGAGGLPENVAKALNDANSRLKQLYTDSPDMLIAEARYGIISGAVSEAVTRTIEERHDLSDRIDTILINPFLGLPIFLILMYLVFWMTFAVGDPFMGWLETFFGWLGNSVAGFWPEGSESALKSLLVDGIIGGVGGVIVFLPNIMILFLAIAFLEDTGYMARAAFIMDRLMHKIGLHGKSFIPMLIGFGCSIPAIMGTRILENKRDRLVTIMVIPLMSCGARLPIYALIIPAFFPQHFQGPMLWIIYLIGILTAILLTRILRSTLFKGESTPFVMELPPYRIPTIQALLIHGWERGSLYLQKAGTVILAISIILWVMTSYPKVHEYSVDYDSRMESLRTAYESSVMELNSDLGLAADHDGILATLDDSFANDEFVFCLTGNETADTFLHTVFEIREINTEFDQTVGEQELEEDTPDYILVKNEFESRFDMLEKDNPDIYPSAEKYIESILPPYIEGSKDIEFSIGEEDLENSAMGRISKTIEPLFLPLGFDWKIVTATLGALAAKEVFVAQLGIVYSIGEADEESDTLRQKLQDNYNPLIGFCIMLFSLISAPCIATLAITRAETKSWGLALLQFFGLTALAWFITVIVYQIGSALGWGV